ncbi:uspA domain protein [Natrialba taiwanensis DSM 12281]|uniref:UspA domain protein n=1 Tax=Natrialba taiwanensis DSM 12281 TaxID=1230458 RepID=M0A5Y3_9EURY|nr:uspA domain protein [Natrialba taiwanensis DSM 12281]
MTVRDGADDVESGYRRILLAIDGSDSSRQAGTYAFDLAAAYDATVYGIHIVETRFGSSDPIRRMLEQQGEESIQDARVQAARASVELVPTEREGDPAREILDFAAKQDIDLIVLGTHGRAGFDRVVMGSVASDVIREAKQAVLTVRVKSSE